MAHLFELIFWVVSQAVPAVIEITVILFKLVLWILFEGLPDLLLNVVPMRWRTRKDGRSGK